MTTPINTTNMNTIRTWDNVMPFAGSIIAFKTNSYYFDRYKGYTLEDPAIKFGYISTHYSKWECGGKGYSMTRLLPPSQSVGICALAKPHINTPISMRFATKEETLSIRKAMIEDEANFECIGKEDGISILDDHMTRLSTTEFLRSLRWRLKSTY